jgi:hypothetical protein
MYYPWTPSMILAYQEARLEELRANARLRVASTSRRRLRERLLLSFGAFLISAGHSLQERYEPVMALTPEACRSATGKACT